VIQPERIQLLNDKPLRPGRYVLYWMQASQRADYNHALEYAVREANAINRPVVAIFALTPRFPEANERHYAFMLEGLCETQQTLKARGIQLAVLLASPPRAVPEAAQEACLLVTDRGYLRIQKQWRAKVARAAPCRMVQVESDVIVPVELASHKEEYAARTFRPRIARHLARYLVPFRRTSVKRDSLGLLLGGVRLDDAGAVLKQLRLSRAARQVPTLLGGPSRAKRLLKQFITAKLARYHEIHSDPGLDGLSHMSPYLHFGQISPLYLALRVRATPGPGSEAYLEELIVRRELSMNFVHYNARYDDFACLPEWARRTLNSHRGDSRPQQYTQQQLEEAATDDPYWNAAQREMVVTGKMHGYMRMYWGKKLLEWSPDPEQAFRTALALNNKYELDGRDPNGFAGVAWCFGKHDRPWQERPIFGTVRYMSAAGLERKFNMDAYLRRVATLGQ